MSADDVTIPAHLARDIADWLRTLDKANGLVMTPPEWAAALDPQPRSLRDEVARAWCAEVYGDESSSAKNPADDHLLAAEAVLAVVADWLAAQPLVEDEGHLGPERQRDHDVRLLRGES